jgi:hypothetical protein
MYLVLSAFTSSPIPLAATTKAFAFNVCIYPVEFTAFYVSLMVVKWIG